jgi:pimeloyl-ACP methyl ester carboxylesterase
VGVIAAIALVALASGATAAPHRPTRTDFYTPPSPLVKRAPGTLIRSEPITAPAGAKAWRILYHSRAVDGHDIAASGVVVVPTGAAPTAGRTVVTWAHGTTGLADQCAPSKATDAASTIPLVAPLLAAGYVVVATDYEGLGTPGTHPYLVGESEGRSVLDAARAARALEATDGNARVLVAGHSQGGQAALFAGELAASYAPDLDVLGVAAAAPAADVEHILPLAGVINGGRGYLVMGVEGFHAAYEQADPASVLTPSALDLASVALTQCADAVRAAYANTSPSSSISGGILAHNPLAIPEIQTLLHQNSAGNRAAGAPLFIAQGSADTTIPQVLTDAFVKKACAAGDTVDYRTYPGATHGSVIIAAQTDMVAWLTARAQGTPAPSTCS